MKSGTSAAWIAWLLAASFYFYQYALRTAPGVMMPQLSEALGITTVAVASLSGIFYYGYSPFSLVAGAALDRIGAKVSLLLAALAPLLGHCFLAPGVGVRLTWADFSRARVECSPWSARSTSRANIFRIHAPP